MVLFSVGARYYSLFYSVQLWSNIIPYPMVAGNFLGGKVAVE
jgi:hypothetical protein